MCVKQNAQISLTRRECVVISHLFPSDAGDGLRNTHTHTHSQEVCSYMTSGAQGDGALDRLLGVSHSDKVKCLNDAVCFHLSETKHTLLALCAVKVD